MKLLEHIATHFRDLYTGNNWTSVNVRDALEGLSWQEANTGVDNLNTIAALVYHINYYVSEVSKVFEGAPLTASDKFSFAVPSITSQNDWDKLVKKVFDDAETFAAQVEKLNEEILFQDFADPKYGTYYRNIQGIIEHTYYHLGQIIIIRKMLKNKGEPVSSRSQS